jgi:hypothetical protein
MKNRFQSLPFKFNPQRYSTGHKPVVTFFAACFDPACLVMELVGVGTFHVKAQTASMFRVTNI